MKERLEQLGGKYWEKGEMKRIYFNYDEIAGFYGLVQTGNFSNAFTVDGESVSNNTGRYYYSTIRSCKFWYDLTAGEFTSKELPEAMFNKIVERIEAKLAEMEAETTETAVVADDNQTTTEATSSETSAPSPGSVRTAVGPGIYTQVRKNNKTGRCRCCGRMLMPGEGRLYYIDPNEAYEESGWIVECLDENACKEYQEKRTIYHK
jgi:hypothetical protein